MMIEGVAAAGGSLRSLGSGRARDGPVEPYQHTERHPKPRRMSTGSNFEGDEHHQLNNSHHGGGAAKRRGSLRARRGSGNGPAGLHQVHVVSPPAAGGSGRRKELRRHNSKVKVSTDTLVTRGIECVVHCWEPPPPFFRHNQLDPGISTSYKGVVVIFHGLAGHSKFPTVRYLANTLALKGNFYVYGLDFPGHGLSPGVRGLISSAADLVEDGLAMAEYARKKHPDLPLFLAGSSMGGGVALSVSLCFTENEIAGLVLLAPMIKVDVPNWQRRVLRGMSKFSPSKALIPNSDVSGELQFRDPKRRDEVNNDKLAYCGSLRVASAYSCIKLYTENRDRLSEVDTPFLCIVAGEDYVVDNSGAQELYDRCKTRDKTLKSYPALHGLLCEPQPLRGHIERKVMEWLSERAIQRRASLKTVSAQTMMMRDAFLSDLEEALDV